MQLFNFLHPSPESLGQSLTIRPLRDWRLLCLGTLCLLAAFAALGVEAYRGMAASVRTPTTANATFNLSHLSSVATSSAERVGELQLLQTQGSGINDPSQ